MPWFQQAYNKFVEGQRFADQIPGTRTYSGLTLGSRHQPSKLSELQRKDIHDQNRFLTKDMRDLGMKEPPAWYVPRDEIDYYMQTGQLPKALAANAANADLTGVRVPKRLDDGSYVDAKGDVMMHDDMADYFQRLRAAPAQPNVAAVAGPPPAPATGPIRNNGLKEKRQKQMSIESFV